MDRSSSGESIDSCSPSSLFRTSMKLNGRKGFSNSGSDSLRSLIPLTEKFNFKNMSSSEQRIIEEINELTRIHQNQLIDKNGQVSSLIEQINNLNEKMSHLMISQISSKNKHEYEIEINKLRKELSDLQAIICFNDDNYKNQVDCLQSQIFTLEENITDHVSINKELENSLGKNCLIYDQINTRISEMADDFSLQLNQYVESINKVENLNRFLLEDYQCTLELLKKENDENVKNKEMLMELQDSINLCKDDLCEALKRCKMYEVVQTETSKTINVLSRRLHENEFEVDHLNDIQLNLVEKRNNLEERVKSLSVENLVIRNSLDYLQQTVRLEIEGLQNQLVEKVETFKQVALEESEKQKVCVEEKQKTIDILLTDIDEYKSRKAEDDFLLNSCYAKIEIYQKEITSLKTALANLEQEYQEKIKSQKALFSQLSLDYESLKEFSYQEKNQLEEKLFQMNVENSTLESTCADQLNRIVILETAAEESNHKLNQNQVKIKHLENLTNEYDNEIYKMSNQIEEKVKVIENLERTKAKIDKEKLDLKVENTSLLESLSCRVEECKVLEEKLKYETITVTEIKKELKTVEVSNQKYTEDLSQELVSEKKKVSDLEMLNKELLEENLQLNNVLSEMRVTIFELEKEGMTKVSRDDFEVVMKQLEEKIETVQILEYEKVNQSLSITEHIEQKDDLLKVIEKQNKELEALSNAVKEHNAARLELEQKIKALQEEQQLLKESGKEDSMKMTVLEASLADLESKNKELNEIIGPFKKQLLQYELEKNFLLSKSKDTEKALRLIEEEHAKSLGHQNHKQKIKHIVNLNQNISNLKKDLEKYRLENMKLKHELSAKKPSSLPDVKKNKENKTKPQGNGQSTGLGTATALKDRNG